MQFTTISRNTVQHQRSVKARIRAAAEQLGDFPYMARNTDRVNVRVRTVNPFPYLIFYTIRNEEVMILHIRHGARQPISGPDE